MQKIKIAFIFAIIIFATLACNAVTSTPVTATPTAARIIAPTQTQSTPTIVPTQAQVKIPQTVDEVVRVSLANAKDAFDNQSAIFIDARSKQAYETSHIKGAIYIGDFESNSKLNADKNQWIITYCT